MKCCHETHDADWGKDFKVLLLAAAGLRSKQTSMESLDPGFLDKGFTLAIKEFDLVELPIFS